VVVAAVEDAFDDREHGPDVLAERLDAVVYTLRSHLAHEEKDAVPLLARTITHRELKRLSRNAVHSLSRAELEQTTPFMFEGAPEDRARRMLHELPVPVQLCHRFWWEPKYRRTRRWE